MEKNIKKKKYCIPLDNDILLTNWSRLESS